MVWVPCPRLCVGMEKRHNLQLPLCFMSLAMPTQSRGHGTLLPPKQSFCAKPVFRGKANRILPTLTFPFRRSSQLGAGATGGLPADVPVSGGTTFGVAIVGLDK